MQCQDEHPKIGCSLVSHEKHQRSCLLVQCSAETEGFKQEKVLKVHLECFEDLIADAVGGEGAGYEV